MLPLIGAILAASLLGSLHCAGMCGAFVAIATNDSGSMRRHLILQIAYHGGRLASYTALGVAAGTAGHLLNLTGALAGISSIASIVAGGTILAFAGLTLARLSGWQVFRATSPAFLAKFAQPIYRAAINKPPVFRAASIGLCTTLLPCGWLYAFAVTAAATASPLRGALTMAVFWTGTLPALVAVGAGLRSILGPLQRRMPVATAMALILAAVFTISNRAQLDPRALGASLESRHVQIPSPGSAPCCKPHDDTHRR